MHREVETNHAVFIAVALEEVIDPDLFHDIFRSEENKMSE